MDNRGRTYLFTFLVMASVLVVLGAMSFASAGKPAPGCDNDGVCEKGEDLLTCGDCGVVIEGGTSACQMSWAGINEISLQSAGGVGVSKCLIGGSCGTGTSSATTCSEIAGEYGNMESAFYAWYTNTCGCGSKATCDQNVIDHTGCGYGNKGCGHNVNGKGVQCLNKGNTVVSPKEIVAGTTEDFREDGTVVANSCGTLCTISGWKYNDPASTSGACYYVNKYNTVRCTATSTTL